MAMTPEDYAALNQANARRTPVTTTRRPTMQAFRANNARAYGYDSTYDEALKYDAAKTKREIWLKAVLPTVAFATGGAASAALMGGGTAAGGAAGGTLAGAANTAVVPYAAPVAASGTSAVGAGTATAAGGGGMTFGNLLKLGELGVGLGTNIYNNRSNNRALERDASMRQNEFAQQLELTRQQNALAEQRYAAEQAQRAQEFAMLQEDRQRRIAEENRLRALDEAREQRRAPRRALSQDALLRLRDLIGLGGQ